MSKKQLKTVTVFAPASVGNIGPGFDVLGCAVTGIGDWVTASLSSNPGIRIHSVSGTQNQIPRDASKNTVGIAAHEVGKLLRIKRGVDLWVHKNIPGSGLGSSAASAVAGGYATNILFGEPLKKRRFSVHAQRRKIGSAVAIFWIIFPLLFLGGWWSPILKQK